MCSTLLYFFGCIGHILILLLFLSEDEVQEVTGANNGTEEPTEEGDLTVLQGLKKKGEKQRTKKSKQSFAQMKQEKVYDVQVIAYLTVMAYLTSLKREEWIKIMGIFLFANMRKNVILVCEISFHF